MSVLADTRKTVLYVCICTESSQNRVFGKL